MSDVQPPPINLEWLVRMRNKKPALLLELCTMFLRDEPERIKTIRAAVECGDFELARYHAHSLKGAAAVMGMDPLRDACRELEHAVRDAHLDALSECLASLEREAEAVCRAMQRELSKS